MHNRLKKRAGQKRTKERVAVEAINNPISFWRSWRQLSLWIRYSNLIERLRHKMDKTYFLEAQVTQVN